MQVLAFGGKAVLWFTYWQYFGEAIVDSDGNPSSIYDAVRRVNHDVRVMGKALLNAPSTAVYESGLHADGGTLPPANGIVQLTSPADVTIGMFSVPTVPNSSSATKALVMLANRNAKATTFAPLKFLGMAKKLNKATGMFEPWLPPKGKGPGVELGPGDGELFQLFIP
jgi:hypothetical protein